MVSETGFLPKVHGEPLYELPKDLYIPPEALEVFLEMFEGPLDLLLFLIKRQHLDILDIPIARITYQYMEYIELMQALRYDLASEYLVMAATLAEIKSKMMLPKPSSDEEQDIDPRVELVRQLQVYETVKQASQAIDDKSRLERDLHLLTIDYQHVLAPKQLPELTWQSLRQALEKVLERAEKHSTHEVVADSLTVDERVSQLKGALKKHKSLRFIECCDSERGRIGVVVSFMALLELARNMWVTVSQQDPLAPVYINWTAE